MVRRRGGAVGCVTCVGLIILAILMWWKEYQVNAPSAMIYGLAQLGTVCAVLVLIFGSSYQITRLQPDDVDVE